MPGPASASIARMASTCWCALLPLRHPSTCNVGNLKDISWVPKLCGHVFSLSQGGKSGSVCLRIAYRVWRVTTSFRGTSEQRDTLASVWVRRAGESRVMAREGPGRRDQDEPRRLLGRQRWQWRWRRRRRAWVSAAARRRRNPQHPLSPPWSRRRAAAAPGSPRAAAPLLL